MTEPNEPDPPGPASQPPLDYWAGGSSGPGVEPIAGFIAGVVIAGIGVAFVGYWFAILFPDDLHLHFIHPPTTQPRPQWSPSSPFIFFVLVAIAAIVAIVYQVRGWRRRPMESPITRAFRLGLLCGLLAMALMQGRCYSAA